MIRIIMILALCYLPLVSAKDVTKLVKENTCFDENIKNACAGKCGNRGSSNLDSIDISHKTGNLYNVVSKATAKYYEHKSAFIGGGIGVKYTIKVTAKGILNSSTCILTVKTIDISGDNFGIAKGAKQQEGKTHLLKNCNKFI